MPTLVGLNTFSICLFDETFHLHESIEENRCHKFVSNFFSLLKIIVVTCKCNKIHRVQNDLKSKHFQYVSISFNIPFYLQIQGNKLFLYFFCTKYVCCVGYFYDLLLGMCGKRIFIQK